MVKNLPADSGNLSSIPGLGTSPWRRERLPTPVLLPAQFHGRKSLAGCGPWVTKSQHTAEVLTHTQQLMYVYSCNSAMFLHVLLSLLQFLVCVFMFPFSHICCLVGFFLFVFVFNVVLSVEFQNAYDPCGLSPEGSLHILKTTLLSSPSLTKLFFSAFLYFLRVFPRLRDHVCSVEFCI